MNLRKRIALVMWWACAQSVVAQSTDIITLPLENIKAAYVDRPGDIYFLSTDHQTIFKYDQNGKLISSKKFEEPITLFDPRDGARMFRYHQSTQQAAFFSEETEQAFPIAQEFAIEPMLACSAGDHNLWILDKADFSLKKISLPQSKLIAEVTLDKEVFGNTPQIIMMREYQNFLFILDKNIGIVVFNAIGKKLRVLEVPNLTYFNFIGEELYYKEGANLIFYDLFDTTTRQEPVDPSCQFVLLTDVRRYVVYPTRLIIQGF